mgnify:CR=1 FL=1
MPSKKNKAHRAGTIAIIGRPSIGKSTLLNRIIGEKVSITARKPQTTREQILGIASFEDAQLAFIDTPGIHQKQYRRINQVMNQAAISSIDQSDVCLLMVDTSLHSDDLYIAQKLAAGKTPVVIALNKVDQINDKASLLPVLESYQKLLQPLAIIPISAKRGHGLKPLEEALIAAVPEQEALYDKTQITDKSDAYMVQELVREQCFRHMGQEIPYSIKTEVERFEYKQAKKLYHIGVQIIVERDMQKAMLIGKRGARLKEIAMLSRLAMEKMLEHKVFLELWVKVVPNWPDKV